MKAGVLCNIYMQITHFCSLMIDFIYYFLFILPLIRFWYLKIRVSIAKEKKCVLMDCHLYILSC